jgi:hypothetical protein
VCAVLARGEEKRRRREEILDNVGEKEEVDEK